MKWHWDDSLCWLLCNEMSYRHTSSDSRMTLCSVWQCLTTGWCGNEMCWVLCSEMSYRHTSSDSRMTLCSVWQCLTTGWCGNEMCWVLCSEMSYRHISLDSRMTLCSVWQCLTTGWWYSNEMKVCVECCAVKCHIWAHCYRPKDEMVWCVMLRAVKRSHQSTPLLDDVDHVHIEMGLCVECVVRGTYCADHCMVI